MKDFSRSFRLPPASPLVFPRLLALGFGIEMRWRADLPDLNVWLALTWPEHSHHRLMCQQMGVQLAEPAHSSWEGFHQLLRGGELPARHCTDAHLAALAIANGWRLGRGLSPPPANPDPPGSRR